MTDQERGISTEVQNQIDRDDHAFSRLQRAIYTLMLVVFFGVMTTIGVWYFEPVPSENYVRELLTKQVYPGQELKLHIQVTWTKSCYSRLRRNIIYSNGVLVPFEREIRLNKEGHRDFVINQLIPVDAPPGPAKWVVITEWFCNPLQYWVPKSVDLEPLEFEILPLKGDTNEGKLQEMPKAGSCLGRGICKPS